MPKNKIDDLRNHLFAALEGLADPDKPMDIARADAIANVARQIIESAKVEVAFLKVTGERKSTDFLPTPEVTPEPQRALASRFARS